MTLHKDIMFGKFRKLMTEEEKDLNLYYDTINNNINRVNNNNRTKVIRKSSRTYEKYV